MDKQITVSLVAAGLMSVAGGAHALGLLIADEAGTQISVSVATSPGFSGTYGGGSFAITPTGLGWPSYVPGASAPGSSEVPAGSFISYCLQIPQTFNFGALSNYSIKPFTTAGDYTAVPPNQPISVGQLDRMGKLMTYAYSNVGFGSGGVSDVEANAVQAGIWEIVYEPVNSVPPDVFDLGIGTFKVTTALTTEMSSVNTWMAAGGAADMLTSYQKYAVLYSANQQDFMVPIPEPEAYGLALAGMGVVAFVMRRRRADNQA